MTENVNFSDDDDLAPLGPIGGFGADDSDGFASSDAADPDIAMPPIADDSDPEIIGTKRFAASAAIQEDSDPQIAGPKTDSKIKRATSKNARNEYLGRTFGGYELVEVIGQGGMGTVYKGRQVSLDRTVAVKLLLPALVTNDEFIKRFEREAKSIARLSHPNIVAVLDFGVSEDGLYYMVIEFVTGTSLSAIISDKLMMTFAEFLPVISQCLAGLDYVSRHGVIHRDIKPDNILVDHTGIAKLADFGLAKDVSENNNDTDLTSVGSAMGTPAYMSPEQCMGRQLDVRSDIYAFGVTAYLALTGEKPFKGNSGFEVMTKQREYVPPTPAELNPQIHKKVSDLIMRMLEKKAIDRFKTASDCRDEWLKIGEELQVMVPSNMRSGEWHAREGSSTDAAIPIPVELAAVPAAQLHAVQVDLPSSDDAEDPFASADCIDSAIPTVLPSVPASDHHVASQSVKRSVGTASVPQFAPPAAALAIPPGASASAPLSAVHAAGPVGHGSEFRRASDVGGTDSSELRICSQCGAQNRAHYTRCQQCAHNFSSDAIGSIDDQMKRADEMEQQGKHKNAMTLYAKLADQTDDRRLRSVIRSKERGARTAFEDKQYTKIVQKADALCSNGDIKGSIILLEQEISHIESPELSDRLQSQVSTLRVALKKKGGLKRLFLWLCIVIVMALGAAYLYRDKIPFVQDLVDKYITPAGASTEAHSMDSGHIMDDADEAAVDSGAQAELEAGAQSVDAAADEGATGE